MKHWLLAFALAGAGLVACAGPNVPPESSVTDPTPPPFSAGSTTNIGATQPGTGGAVADAGVAGDAAAVANPRIVGGGGTNPGTNPAIVGRPGAPGNIGTPGNEFGGVGSDAASSFAGEHFRNFDFDF